MNHARAGLIVHAYDLEGAAIAATMTVLDPSAVEVDTGDFFRIGERYFLGGDPRYIPDAAND